jgi:hypothetical protein
MIPVIIVIRPGSRFGHLGERLVRLATVLPGWGHSMQIFISRRSHHLFRGNDRVLLTDLVR